MSTTPRKASTFALSTVHPTVRVIRRHLHARARETKRAGLLGGPLSNVGLPLRYVASSTYIVSYSPLTSSRFRLTQKLALL